MSGFFGRSDLGRESDDRVACTRPGISIGKLAPALLFASFLFCAAAHAGDGLSYLFKKAETADPDYASARADYASESENRAIGIAGLLPSISITGDTNHTGYERTDLGSKIKREYRYAPHTLGLRLTQPLFDLARIAAFQEGDLRSQHAEIAFADARQDLALRVAQAYYNYLLAMDNLDLARAQKDAYSVQRVQAEHLYKAGMATVTDVEETKARQQLAESQQAAASSALGQRRRELGKIIGELPPAEMPRLVASPALTLPEPANVEPWLDAARTRNMKVLAQQLALSIAGTQVDRANAAFTPSVSLVAIGQQARDPNYFTSLENNKQIGLEVSMSLFEGGRDSAQKRQAEAQRAKARSQLDSALSDAEIKTSEAFFNVVNGIAQVRALEQSVKSAEITVRGMEAGQKSGLRTNSDVLNAQQQLFSNRRDLQKERYGYLINRLSLQGAVGSLTDEEISIIDRLAAAAIVAP